MIDHLPEKMTPAKKAEELGVTMGVRGGDHWGDHGDIGQAIDQRQRFDDQRRLAGLAWKHLPKYQQTSR